MDQNSNFTLLTWIKKVEDGKATVPIAYANCILGSKDNMYRQVRSLGWFIPSFDSKAICTKYLLGILNNQYFRLSVTEVKNPPPILLPWSKIDILAYLESKWFNKPSGFSPDKMPDKAWLVTVLFTAEPNHPIFIGIKTDDEMVKYPLSK